MNVFSTLPATVRAGLSHAKSTKHGRAEAVDGNRSSRSVQIFDTENPRSTASRSSLGITHSWWVSAFLLRPD